MHWFATVLLFPCLLVAAGGPDPIDVLRTRDLIREAETEYGRGNLARAGALTEEALAIQRTFGPIGDLQLASSLHNLAEVYRRQHRLNEAEKLATEAIALRERKLGPDDPEVAAGLQLLSNILHSAGRNYDAEPPLRRAIAILEKRRAPASDRAMCLDSLAALHYALGDLEGARRQLERGLGIQEQAGRGDNPVTASLLHNLGVVSAGLGEPEAEEHYRRAIAMYESLYGPHSIYVAESLAAYSAFLRSAKRTNEARRVRQRAEAIRALRK